MKIGPIVKSIIIITYQHYKFKKDYCPGKQWQNGHNAQDIHPQSNWV